MGRNTALIELLTATHRGIITEDLRLHVWSIDEDHENNPPAYYQNQKITGEPWADAEEIKTFFFSLFENFGAEEVTE